MTGRAPGSARGVARAPDRRPWAPDAVPAPAVVAVVRDRLAVRGADPVVLAEEVRDAAAAHGLVLGVDDLMSAATAVSADLWGLGPLERLVRDPAVTDVVVNGGGRVYVDRGAGLECCGVDVGGEDAVRALAVRLAASAGRRLDDASPWVDARLPGGLRLHAVLPPLTPAGTHLSLRVLRGARWSLTGLVGAGSLPAEWAGVLRALVARRAAFLVSGGTGAGKTTLLSALLSLVPVGERIVLVEDVGELWPDHPHVVRLEARPPNVEGRGAVGLEVLVRQALRMRPDRIVVGECRGAEVRELLAALNTGHAGGCGTVHANSAAEVPARLEALGALAGMSERSVRLQARAALDAVVHVRREPAGRVLSEIAAIAPDGEVLPALVRTGPATEPRFAGDPCAGEASARRQGLGDGCLGDGGLGDGGVGWHLGPGWRMLAERLGLS